MVLHENDDKLDFSPNKLRLGTGSENAADSYKNGKRDGTKTAWMKCTSYIDDVFEKHYESQSDAVRYLKTQGYLRASYAHISKALAAYKDGKVIVRYGRTWKLV